jgi:hypothetical protein
VTVRGVALEQAGSGKNCTGINVTSECDAAVEPDANYNQPAAQLNTSTDLLAPPLPFENSTTQPLAYVAPALRIAPAVAQPFGG